MKIRIRKDKKTGETFVQYGDTLNIEKFRYMLLKSIIEGCLDATLIIDTNQKKGEGNIEKAEEFLKQSGIKYSAFPAKQNDVKFFGFDIPKKAINQKIIVLKITGEQFSMELFDTFLKRYDIAIGIGSLKPYEEMCDMLKIDLSKVLFNAAFFKESIYDSAVCGSLRSSGDIKQYIEAAIK